MNGRLVLPSLVALISTLVLVTSAIAENEAERLIVYKPPTTDTTKVRVDGFTRVADASLPSLFILSPDHVGLTTKEQPCIFWYQSKPLRTRVELTIVQDKKLIPVCEIKLDKAPKAGIQRLRLADHNVRLAIGVEYRCTVALVVDESSRSKDVVASSVIKRVDTFESLKTRLAKAEPSEVPFIYAGEGIWFDSIEALADLIDTQPDPRRFHRQRSALLEQVKLADAAAYEARLARVN